MFMSVYKNTWKDAVVNKKDGFRFAFGSSIYEIRNGEPVLVTDTKENPDLMHNKIGVLNVVMRDNNGDFIVEGEKNKIISREYALYCDGRLVKWLM